MKKLIVVLAVLAAALGVCPRAKAQGGYKDGVALNSRGLPAGGVDWAVCMSGAMEGTSSTPCSPTAAIYSDPALTQPLSNNGSLTTPLTTDGLGNFSFYATPGLYTIEFYGPLINLTFKTIQVSGTGTGGPGGSVMVNGTIVASPNFNGTTPAAPSGYSLITWQVSGSGISTYIPSPFLVPQIGSAAFPSTAFLSGIDFSGSQFGFYSGSGSLPPSPSGVYTTGWNFPCADNLPCQWNPTALAWRTQADMGSALGSYTPGHVVTVCADPPDLCDGGAVGSGTMSDGAGTATANELPVSTATAHQYSLVATLPTAAVPAFTGDVTNTAGSLATTVGKVNGAAVPASQTCLGSNSSSQLVTGTCAGTVGGTVTYTSSQTGSSSDNGKLVLMNCSSSCAYTLPTAQPSTTWFLMGIESIGSTTATLALGGSDTLNGGTTLPGLNALTALKIWANSSTSTDYRGEMNAGYKEFPIQLIPTYASGSPSAPGVIATFITSAPITITRIVAYAAGANPVGCSTTSKYGYYSGTGLSGSVSPSSALATLSNGNGMADSGPLSIAIAANTVVGPGIIAGEAGCSTNAADVSVVMEYQ